MKYHEQLKSRHRAYDQSIEGYNLESGQKSSIMRTDN